MCSGTRKSIQHPHDVENKNGDTHVSESQIIAEEVLFELGQSGSANLHRRSLPWLNSNSLIVTETAAFRDSMSKHSQERRTAPNAKHSAGWSSHLTPTGHTLEKQTDCVLCTCICCLTCFHVSQNIPAVFKQQAERDVGSVHMSFCLKGLEVLPLLRSRFMKKKKKIIIIMNK